MAVIAYASGNSNPQANPLVDIDVDLSSVSLPTSVNVYGDAVDTANPSATFSWSWTLVDPDNTGITLSSSTTQNITVSNISTWHNVRLFLVATNTATAETSESDQLIAPSSAFIEIRLLSENKGIQKLAKGSRSWQSAMEAWATAIESAGSTLNQLSDVANATGAQLDVLVSGNNAESGGNPLHIHDGDHVANATTTTAGVVQLEEASNAVGVPRVITQERIILTGSATRSNDGNVIVDAIIYQSNGGVLPHVAWKLTDDIEVIGYTIAMADASATSLVFDICLGTDAKYNARTMVAQNVKLTLTPAFANDPAISTLSFGSSPLSVSAGTVLGIVITNGASTLANGGHGLSVTVEARRRVV